MTPIIEIEIIIPIGHGRNAEVTVTSLLKQNFINYRELGINVIVHEVHGEPGENANVLRNRGFKEVTAPFVIFSDDDINWMPDAIESMYKCLNANPQASYCYGYYDFEEDGYRQCNVEFDPDRLRKTNYISTMTLIRSKDFPGFDESILRLQDWDLWLTMLSQDKVGVYCGKLVFTTKRGEGITFGKTTQPWREAMQAIIKKHNLDIKV